MSEQRDGKTPETALDGIVEVQMTTTEYEHIQNLLEREKHTFCAFCGGKFPGSGTTDDLKEHMLSCEHHPMAAQRQRIAQLEGEVNAMRTASQLTHFILEHPDGDYDKPEQIQAEAEQYGLEKLFALKAEVARLKGTTVQISLRKGTPLPYQLDEDGHP